VLRNLSIRDFVLIDQLDVAFEPGLTTLTGETGAGKSIVLDALGLALGARADVGMIRVGAARAEITASFEWAETASLREWLAEVWQDEMSEDNLILKRVLDSNGKSRAFINNKPVPITALRSLGACLLDVHAQHEHQSLLKATTQRDLLDEFADNAELRKAVRQAHHRHSEAAALLARATTEADVLARERDALSLECDELNQLAPQAGEWEELNSKQARLANSALIIEKARAANLLLSEEEDRNVAQDLVNIETDLAEAAKHDSALKPIIQQITEGRYLLDDAAVALNTYLSDADFDTDGMDELESRLSALFHAGRRYRLPPGELPQLRVEKTERLQALNASSNLAALSAELKAAQAQLSKACTSLTQSREKAVKQLAKSVNERLATLAMSQARFAIDLPKLAEPSSSGTESVDFQLASHASLSLQSIAKAASGGELARIGLAIMVAVGQRSEIPSLVFDEVDVGIGGVVADVVGQQLKQLASHHQVICVTHQAQVAAHAATHFQVQKSADKKKASTALAQLNDSQRVEELARMLAGAAITDTTRAHAREMLQTAQQ
jgi:DNA repair protein RecN (Recombination protein N)